MTENIQEQAAPVQPQSDKEYNFAQIRKQLEQERQARLQAEQRAAEYERSLQQRQQESPDEYDDSEPYVDHKRLEKKFSSFEKRMEEKIDKKAEERARMMLGEERRNSWLKNNPDFYDVLQHAEKFAQHDPELAETILEMPEGFERQKLVYKNIKALGLHKPQEPQKSVQDKIDSNRRSPYYQPSGVGTAPYASNGNYSPQGQKDAYQKMQELKNRLRLG